MANNVPYISSTQVASSTPFDNVAAPTFTSTDVQAALKEIRDQPTFNSATQATTASGTLTLTNASLGTQFFTGSASGYNIQLPAANTYSTTAPPGSVFYQLFNTSSQQVQVKDGSGANLFILSQNSIGFVWLQTGGSVAGTWAYYQVTSGGNATLINYNLQTTTTFSTSSTTDVQITSFSFTPQSGTYAVWFSGAASMSGAGSDAICTIYKGASAITDSFRTNTGTTGTHSMMINTQTIAQFDGSTIATVYVRTSGNLTITGRSLLLIRLGV